MTRIRLILAVLVAAISLACITAAPASAHPVSWGYCHDTLRGWAGGSYGPYAYDNDIKWQWDLIESQGYDVTSSGPYAIDYPSEGVTRLYWAFNSNGGQHTRAFYCRHFHDSGWYSDRPEYGGYDSYWRAFN